MGANSSSLSRSTSRSSGDVVGTNNLPPIMFHSTHGENVRLLRNGALARRTESFCKGITFSNRPIKINEKIFLKFAETSTSWSGVLRFGFSSFDPSTLRGSLPKYACPDFTNKQGYWAKALAERYAEQGLILFFYVNSNGDVYFGINGEEKGIFFSGVDTSVPLWAMLDIYGNTIAVELLDCRSQLNNVRHRSLPTLEGVDQVIQSMRSLSINPSGSLLSSENASSDVHPMFSTSRVMELLPFHRVHGRNISLSSDYVTATRADSEFSSGYVFTSRPLLPEQKFLIQVLQTERSYVGALAFGLTTCDPNTIAPHELPDDSDLLLDRPEYWVVLKDVANCPHVGDELGFSITKDGKVLFYRKHHSPITIMHVDQTQTMWPFFDVYGNTLKIKSLGIFQNCPVPSLQVRSSSLGDQLRVALPPRVLTTIQEDRNRSPSSQGGTSLMFMENKSLSAVVAAGLDGSLDNSNNECSVCYERGIDSVLYSCGHMCMCYQCAVQLWKKSGDSQCPICRATIKDVIRTYRS